MRDYDVTSAGISAEQDRNHRMKVYFIMMSIRMACVFSLIWVRGWWILVAALGGIALPYIAVLLANAPKNVVEQSPERPTPLEISATTPTVDAAPTVIIIDEPADRRSQAKEDS